MSKLMRRIWSILIAVAMCVTILPLNAFALDESTGTMVATFDQVSALVGETAQVKLTLKNNPGITSFKLAVKWDADFLTLEGIDYNSALGGMSIPPASSTSPAYIQWVSGTSNVDLNGVFATLKFKVSEDAPANALATITADFDPDDICKLVKNGDTYVRHSSTRDRDRVRERDRDRKRERGRNGTPRPRCLWQIQQCDTDRYRAFRAENRAARQVGVLP